MSPAVSIRLCISKSKTPQPGAFPAIAGSIMKTLLSRIGSTLVLVVLSAIAGVRLVLDVIGWSTAPDDVGTALTRLDQLLLWILELPWPVPWLSALAAGGWLIYVSWPSQQALPSPDGHEKLPPPREDTSKKREIAKSLDDLYAEGVKHRNEIAAGPALGVKDYSMEEYRQAIDQLGEWSDRTLKVMDNGSVPVRIMSAFRTLNTIRFGQRENLFLKSHVRAIWNEKLERLQKVINSF